MIKVLLPVIIITPVHFYQEIVSHFAKGLFILAFPCIAMLIYQSLSAATQRNTPQFQMNLTLLRHRSSVTPQSLCCVCRVAMQHNAMLV